MSTADAELEIIAYIAHYGKATFYQLYEHLFWSNSSFFSNQRNPSLTYLLGQMIMKHSISFKDDAYCLWLDD